MSHANCEARHGGSGINLVNRSLMAAGCPALERNRTMTPNDIASERTLSFWMTLLVTTLIVGLAAYVLSFALLGPGGALPTHRAAVTSVIMTAS